VPRASYSSSRSSATLFLIFCRCCDLHNNSESIPSRFLLTFWHGIQLPPLEWFLQAREFFSSAFIFSPSFLGIVRMLCFELPVLSLPSCRSTSKVNASGILVRHLVLHLTRGRTSRTLVIFTYPGPRPSK